MRRPGSAASSRRASVVLPAPEGEDSTSSRPRRAMRGMAAAVGLPARSVARSRSAHSMFCTCSRIWSMTALSSRPARVVSGSLALEHSVLASRLNSWARKSRRRPAGSREAMQLARAGDVRAQALQFLLHVGARRQHSRLLVKTPFIEADAGLQQPPDLLLEPLADGFGRARRARPRPIATRRSMAATWSSTMALRWRPSASRARTMPSSASVSPASMRRGARLRLGLALLRLDHLEHALDAEQRLGARGRGLDLRLEAVERGQHLAQRGFVEPDARLAFAALDVQVDGEVAAHDALAHRLADARLQRLVARRQAQAHVEAASVDGAHLPVPAQRPHGAVGPGKAGHALDGHVSASSMLPIPREAPCVASGAPIRGLERPRTVVAEQLRNKERGRPRVSRRADSDSRSPSSPNAIATSP